MQLTGRIAEQFLQVFLRRRRQNKKKIDTWHAWIFLISESHSSEFLIFAPQDLIKGMVQ